MHEVYSNNTYVISIHIGLNIIPFPCTSGYIKKKLFFSLRRFLYKQSYCRFFTYMFDVCMFDLDPVRHYTWDTKGYKILFSNGWKSW